MVSLLHLKLVKIAVKAYSFRALAASSSLVYSALVSTEAMDELYAAVSKCVKGHRSTFSTEASGSSSNASIDEA